jgi:hypothetical protein
MFYCTPLIFLHPQMQNRGAGVTGGSFGFVVFFIQEVLFCDSQHPGKRVRSCALWKGGGTRSNVVYVEGVCWVRGGGGRTLGPWAILTSLSLCCCAKRM